eukprot:9423403-Lingulodinium_polyedra.AAC.1
MQIKEPQRQPKKKPKANPAAPFAFANATDIDQSAAQRFAPPSCRVLKDHFNGRWRSYFVEPFRGCPGRSSSWTSRGEDGEFLALQIVLSASWQQYTTIAGTPCPHNKLLID